MNSDTLNRIAPEEWAAFIHDYGRDPMDGTALTAADVLIRKLVAAVEHEKARRARAQRHGDKLKRAGNRLADGVRAFYASDGGVDIDRMNDALIAWNRLAAPEPDSP